VDGKIILIGTDLESIYGISALLAAQGHDSESLEPGELLPKLRNGLQASCLLLDAGNNRDGVIRVIHEIRNSALHQGLPIIVMTEADQQEVQIEALKAGASVCLYYPVVEEELLAQIDVQMRMWKLQRQLARQLEINDNLLAGLKEDMALGQQVQKSFLPPGELKTSNFALEARLIPSGDLSGDYYDYRLITPERLVIFLADVSGHGVASALLAGRLKAFFDENFRRAHRPRLFLEQLNRVLNDLGEHYHIATAACIHIDVMDTTLVYANAGHRSLYWLDTDTKSHKLLPATGPAIGMFEEFDIDESTHGFLPGRNRLVCFTDGLVEFRRPDGEWATEEQFRDNLILPKMDEGIEDYLEILLDGSSEQTGGAGWDDDVSLVVADF
jgi:sigma-B regulation protein RsbU (phosphoserine phosphatase)